MNTCTLKYAQIKKVNLFDNTINTAVNNVTNKQKELRCAEMFFIIPITEIAATVEGSTITCETTQIPRYLVQSWPESLVEVISAFHPLEVIKSSPTSGHW